MRHSKIIILSLLVLAIGINYVDRGTLSVSKSDIAAEFKLDSTAMGWLFSAFFWSYALFQLAAGWLVDRYSVKWIYAGGFLIWSVATAAMGWMEGFWVFFMLRLALGIGESVAYPATSKILAENTSEHQRGLANSLIDAGSKIGPALSLLVGGLVVAEFGWRFLFLAVGLGSLLWLPLWIVLVPNEIRRSDLSAGEIVAIEKQPAVTWTALLRRSEVWVTSLGMFCLGYVWYFLVSWLPGYLETYRHFDKESMAIFGSLPFWAMAVTAILGGSISDACVRSGRDVTRVRKSFLILGFAMCGILMVPAVFAQHAGWCIAFLTAACASLGIYTSNVWAVTQSLAGPRASGKWSGLQNCIGNMGGVISPLLSGWLETQTKSFTLAFLACTVVLLIGAALYGFGLRSLKPIDWDSPETEPTRTFTR
ncbi:MAG: MFS transporter [Pirellulales bacterium]